MLFSLDCSLNCVSLSLLKEGRKFFTAEVNGLSTEVGIKGDTSTSVRAQLKSFGCKDLYNSPWSDMLTAGGENEMAITMSFANFNSESPFYPGHDMEIGVKMASIRVAFTNRYVLCLHHLTEPGLYKK